MYSLRIVTQVPNVFISPPLDGDLLVVAKARRDQGLADDLTRISRWAAI
jgi:hypothetical protein